MLEYIVYNYLSYVFMAVGFIGTAITTGGMVDIATYYEDQNLLKKTVKILFIFFIIIFFIGLILPRESYFCNLKDNHNLKFCKKRA